MLLNPRKLLAIVPNSMCCWSYDFESMRSYKFYDKSKFHFMVPKRLEQTRILSRFLILLYAEFDLLLRKPDF
jgi:hypothetical protein